jgi:Cu/Ag efflux pump CusA
VVPLALLLIFVLLYGTFGAAGPALLIILNVPLAAVGGVFALIPRGMVSGTYAPGFLGPVALGTVCSIAVNDDEGDQPTGSSIGVASLSMLCPCS